MKYFVLKYANRKIHELLYQSSILFYAYENQKLLLFKNCFIITVSKCNTTRKIQRILEKKEKEDTSTLYGNGINGYGSHVEYYK